MASEVVILSCPLTEEVEELMVVVHDAQSPIVFFLRWSR